MKITIIKPKTGITMKMNSNNLIRLWRTLSEPAKAPKCEQNLFMQNEPNFQCSRSKLNAVIAVIYNENPLVNQKITNPIEPNTNPISKRPKFNANFCCSGDLQ